MIRSGVRTRYSPGADSNNAWKSGGDKEGERLSPARRSPANVGGITGLADPIPQDADPLDLHLHLVARLHLLRLSRGAGVDEVARRQGDEAADVTDHGGAVEEQIGGVLLLHHLAIEAGLQEDLVVVEAGDDGGTAGGEGVGALGPPPLQALARAALPLPFADVVAAGDAEDRFP